MLLSLLQHGSYRHEGGQCPIGRGTICVRDEKINSAAALEPYLGLRGARRPRGDHSPAIPAPSSWREDRWTGFHRRGRLHRERVSGMCRVARGSANRSSLCLDSSHPWAGKDCRGKGRLPGRNVRHYCVARTNGDCRGGICHRCLFGRFLKRSAPHAVWSGEGNPNGQSDRSSRHGYILQEFSNGPEIPGQTGLGASVMDHRLQGGGFKGCQLEIDHRRALVPLPGPQCTL